MEISLCVFASVLTIISMFRSTLTVNFGLFLVICTYAQIEYSPTFFGAALKNLSNVQLVHLLLCRFFSLALPLSLFSGCPFKRKTFEIIKLGKYDRTDKDRYVSPNKSVLHYWFQEQILENVRRSSWIDIHSHVILTIQFRKCHFQLEVIVF